MELKKYDEKKDFLLLFIILLSVVLLIYSFYYIYQYYGMNNLITSVPKNRNNDGEILNPNEIGDSIGGTLNPIIAITASMLTFLAFYIQYKANKSQKEIFNLSLDNEVSKLTREKEIKELEVIKYYQTNLKIFKTLIESMVVYFEENGRYAKTFIEEERSFLLGSNILKYSTDSSFKYFEKLEFREIYNSIVYYFNERYPSIDWEDDFIEVLNIIEFYNKFLSESRDAFKKHSTSKYKNLTEVGLRLDEKMGDVFSDENLNTHSSLLSYLKIIHNRDEKGNIIIPNEIFSQKGVDFQSLQIEFFNNFIPHLKSIYDTYKTPHYKDLLESFSKMNKSIGTEIFQTNNYLHGLELNYEQYYNLENTDYPLQKVKEFIAKIYFD